MNRKPAVLNPSVRRLIADAGNTTQSFGIGRVLGQIFAFLYFSPQPRSLGDMEEALGISKGSASMGVRQLEQWGAVRKVWVKGDRKDYYEANDWIGKVLKNAILETVGRKMILYGSLLDEVETDLPLLGPGNGEGRFVRERIQQLRSFQQKAQKVWNSPLVRMLLK